MHHVSSSERKSSGITYTPIELARFVSEEIVSTVPVIDGKFRILDPAVGDGELVIKLLQVLAERSPKIQLTVEIWDTDSVALKIAEERLGRHAALQNLLVHNADFLEYASGFQQPGGQKNLLSSEVELFDFIISNPPYVRTQILGSEKSRELAHRFGLKGRVDLYHAFVIAMTRLLKPEGVLGIITSNRFMTTKSGESCRAWYLEHFNLRSIYDLGDTKVFNDAVLPVVIVASRSVDGHGQRDSDFTSVYESEKSSEHDFVCENIFDALRNRQEGTVRITNRVFQVQRGKLKKPGNLKQVWALTNSQSSEWLSKVDRNTALRFRDVGKVRVGVKTTADKIFIRKDWNSIRPTPEKDSLRSLVTHKQVRRWRLLIDSAPQILYTHECVDGIKRPIDFERYFPEAFAYLVANKAALEGRKYVIDAGRDWFEIWVPQNPCDWKKPKVVFRDIAEQSSFCVDTEGYIVNGDCYWLAPEEGCEDLLWLIAAVGNSTFAQTYYDRRFNNKLYSGRRRFMTQYVNEFPIPDPDASVSKEISGLARSLSRPKAGSREVEEHVDLLIHKAFGVKKIFW